VDAHLRADVASLDETHLDPDLRSEAEAMLAAVTGDAVAAPQLRDAGALSADQQAILDFERLWWRQPGAKEQAIRDNFEISPTRYYQQLNALLDLPQALSYDPTLINRLQRLRAATSRSRRPR
jgi:hypothetical protein